jgi:mono/diheme cytochrome c family protein
MAVFGFDRSRSDRMRRFFLAAGGVGLVAAVLTAGTAIAQDTALTPLTFTEAQASAGAGLYDGNCAGCHGADLGGLDGPALKGTAFEHWFTGSVGVFFAYVSTAMPLDDPGGLNTTQYINLIAFIASQNGFVAGEAPLPETPEELAEIGFTQP